MNVDYNAIGKRVKAARLKAGLTQERLAELAQLSTSHIGKIEIADTKPSLACIMTIANVLQTSVDALLADNVVYPEVFLERDFEELLHGLTPYELSIMKCSMEGVRNGLLMNRIKATGLD